MAQAQTCAQRRGLGSDLQYALRLCCFASVSSPPSSRLIGWRDVLPQLKVHRPCPAVHRTTALDPKPTSDVSAMSGVL